MNTNIYDISVKPIDGQDQKFDVWKGKVVLVVNVASKCGLTPQYEGLEVMYRKYKDQGLVILGFPCDQFAHQEPGDENEIKRFCSMNYEVSFPIYAKIDVNGPNEHILYQHLKREAPGLFGTKAIKWNFTKFLVDRTGKVIKRYAPTKTPKSIEKDLEKLFRSSF